LAGVWIVYATAVTTLAAPSNRPVLLILANFVSILTIFLKLAILFAIYWRENKIHMIATQKIKVSASQMMVG
jgi:hypothetical protein